MSESNESLTDLAESIEAAAEVRPRLTSGMERRNNEPSTYSPAQFIDKQPATPPTLPSGRSSSGTPSGYVTSDGVAALDTKVHEARRREPDAVLGETKAASSAWSEFIEAADAARVVVKEIPAAIHRARVARSEALAEAGDEPIVLPSAQDARSHADHRAAEACHRALALRSAYDKVVDDSADDRLAALAKSIPAEAAEVVSRVKDLRDAVERLRAGTRTLADVAGQAPGRMSAKMPTSVKLELLDDLGLEVAALQVVAAEPSEPAIRPRISERHAIMRRAAQAPSGLTPEALDLARIERSEQFAHSALTKAFDINVLQNYAANVANGGGYQIR